MALGLQGAMVVEIFPLRTRVTSLSLAYSVTLALAGGTRAAGIGVAGANASASHWHPRGTSWVTASWDSHC